MSDSSTIALSKLQSTKPGEHRMNTDNITFLSEKIDSLSCKYPDDSLGRFTIALESIVMVLQVMETLSNKEIIGLLTHTYEYFVNNEINKEILRDKIEELKYDWLNLD